jgi:alpha-galactosidase
LSNRVTFESCYAEWNGNTLVMGNAIFERSYGVENGCLYTTSLKDKVADVEWVSGRVDCANWMPLVALSEDEPEMVFAAQEYSQMPVSKSSLCVSLRAESKSVTRIHAFEIYPGSASVTGRLTLEGDGVGLLDVDAVDAIEDAEPTGVELLDKAKQNAGPPTVDVLDAFALAPQHLRVTQVRMMDRTDVHNELVFENEWLLLVNENNLQLQGNVFVIEDNLTGNGLLVIKQAPLPHARPVGCAFDVLVRGSDRSFRFYGHGMGQGVGEGYAQTVIAYQKGEVGRQEAMQDFQRQVRAYDSERDGRFLSNTWGDRSQDSRIQEEFMLKEVAAGARMGVDVVQIDDGWEKGTTSNSVNAKLAGGVWEGFWGSDPEFWHPHPERFPKGLENVIEIAREKGMQFGLWFGPDSVDDFKNWEKDAETILDFHHRLGVNYIKIDGVKARTKTSERNLRCFFDRVLEGSKGKVTFDLDVTAEIRPGYFGMMHVGPLFVENRYTDSHRYWPHHTLRNVWKLSRWVDPMRLRMEFLNSARNADKYEGDPLAPQCYASDYLFATVMMVNPLGWFEVSNLADEYVENVAKLAGVWKAHRAALAGGWIHPIGDAPDGTSWTGFASVGEGRNAGYLLIFRELNDRASWRVELPMFLNADFEVEVLAGEGSATLAEGVLAVDIPTSQRYLFARVSGVVTPNDNGFGD